MICYAMLTHLKESKDLMLRFFDDHFRSLEEEYSGINRWGPDALIRLKDFITGGKMIRGGLVRFTHDMFGGRRPQSAVAAGAAMELFQSAFLIHDDIMDRDETRRGKPSVHTQYTGIAASEGIIDAAHIGEALGICAGDIAIFLAFEILGTLDIPGEKKTGLLLRFCRELEYVGLAQMADVYHGASRRTVSRSDILTLYRYKTGRYTFSLPFAAGLILADQDEDLIERFILLGEKLGILFQIKDDELGIWAEEGELGKSVGSDIMENKKTLYREIFFERADDEERGELAELYGKKDLGIDEINRIRERLECLGVRKEVAEMADRLSTEARELIDTLPSPSEEWRKKLVELLEYNRGRKK